MQDHFLEHYFTRILHAECYHCQTVADQDHVHPGSVGNMGTWKVVRSYHRDGFLLLVEGAERIDRDFLAWVDRSLAHGRVGTPPDLTLRQRYCRSDRQR